MSCLPAFFGLHIKHMPICFPFLPQVIHLLLSFLHHSLGFLHQLDIPKTRNITWSFRANLTLGYGRGWNRFFSFSFPSDIEIFLPGLHSGHCFYHPCPHQDYASHSLNLPVEPSWQFGASWVPVYSFLWTVEFSTSSFL